MVSAKKKNNLSCHEFSALPLKVCHKKQEKFHPTLETIDGKEP
jgi:hypothetical protein